MISTYPIIVATEDEAAASAIVEMAAKTGIGEDGIIFVDDRFMLPSFLRLEHYGSVVVDRRIMDGDGSDLLDIIRVSNSPGAELYIFDNLTMSVEEARPCAQVPANNVGRQFSVDADARTITFDGGTLALNPTEYEILSHLVSKAGGTVSPQELVNGCKSLRKKSSAVAGQIVSALRKKLGEEGREIIRSERGVGYSISQRFVPKKRVA